MVDALVNTFIKMNILINIFQIGDLFAMLLSKCSDKEIMILRTINTIFKNKVDTTNYLLKSRYNIEHIFQSPICYTHFRKVYILYNSNIKLNKERQYHNINSLRISKHTLFRKTSEEPLFEDFAQFVNLEELILVDHEITTKITFPKTLKKIEIHGYHDKYLEKLENFSFPENVNIDVNVNYGASSGYLRGPLFKIRWECGKKVLTHIKYIIPIIQTFLTFGSSYDQISNIFPLVPNPTY